jgi:hypothetical protein
MEEVKKLKVLGIFQAMLDLDNEQKILFMRLIEAGKNGSRKDLEKILKEA